MTRKKETDDGLVVVDTYNDFQLTRKQGKNMRWRWQIRKGDVFGAYGPVTGDRNPAETDAAGRVYFDALRAHEKVKRAEDVVEKAKTEVESAKRVLSASERALENERSVTAKLRKDVTRAQVQRNLVFALTVAAIVAAVVVSQSS